MKKQAMKIGLTDDQVRASRKKYGSNILSRKKRKSFFQSLLSSFGDPIIKILLIALGINVLFLFHDADWFEAVGIAIAIFLATFISTLSEYGSARAFERLEQDAGGILCHVRRNGSIQEIPIREVVVGDIVLLSAGDAIPADGRMLLGAPL